MMGWLSTAVCGASACGMVYLGHDAFAAAFVVFAFIAVWIPW